MEKLEMFNAIVRLVQKNDGSSPTQLHRIGRRKHRSCARRKNARFVPTTTLSKHKKITNKTSNKLSPDEWSVVIVCGSST